ncbi:MAG: DUF1566 domain-containing protein [Terracidiphilus sp.]|jgi:hypothetical protein
MRTCPQCDSSHPGNHAACSTRGVLLNEKHKGLRAGWLLVLLLGAVVLPALSQKDEGPILMPKKPIVATSILVICDLACNWNLDGDAKGRIVAGGSARAITVHGQHIVTAVTLDGLDKVKKETNIKAAGQTIVRIELKPVRDARLKPVQEAMEKPVPAPSPTLLVICDLACNWKLDGKAHGHIAAGASATTDVVSGQHLVLAETEDGADQVKQLCDVKSSGQTVVSIELRPVRDARLKAEQQARDKADQEARDKAAQEARDKAARDQQERERLAREEAARPTWTDPATGLMWTKKDNGFGVTWQQATDYCRNLQLAGHWDWRLPTIDELQGIYDPNVKVSHWHVKGNLQLSGSVEYSSIQGNGPRNKGDWVFFSYNGVKRFEPIEDLQTSESTINNRALCVRPSGQ